MKSDYSDYNKKYDIKDIILNSIKNKNQQIKRHSNSVNCLVNCAEYHITMKVLQKPENNKFNLFFIFDIRSP